MAQGSSSAYFVLASKRHLRFFAVGLLRTAMQRYLKKHLVEDLSQKIEIKICGIGQQGPASTAYNTRGSIRCSE
jgi:hypothetical protein